MLKNEHLRDNLRKQTADTASHVRVQDYIGKSSINSVGSYMPLDQHFLSSAAYPRMRKPRVSVTLVQTFNVRRIM